MQKFSTVNDLVNILKPNKPVYCIRPNSIKTSVEYFKKKFPGKVLYAVKTNPNKTGEIPKMGCAARFNTVM